MSDSNMIFKDDAKSLAHAYAGFLGALFSARHTDSLLVWSDALHQIQLRTGVEIMPMSLLHSIIMTGQPVKAPARPLDKIEA